MESGPTGFGWAGLDTISQVTEQKKPYPPTQLHVVQAEARAGTAAHATHQQRWGPNTACPGHREGCFCPASPTPERLSPALAETRDQAQLAQDLWGQTASPRDTGWKQPNPPNTAQHSRPWVSHTQAPVALATAWCSVGRPGSPLTSHRGLEHSSSSPCQWGMEP